MILDFFINMLKVLISAVALVLPNYDTLPLPQWIYDNIALIFGWMKLLLELPIVRVLYDYFQILFPIWLIFWGWNLWIKFISMIPGLSGAKNLHIHKHEKHE